MLLRAYADGGSSSSSSSVVVEARLLADHLPAEASQRLLAEGAESSSSNSISNSFWRRGAGLPLYYRDSSTHRAQEAARRLWKVQPPATAKRPHSALVVVTGTGTGGGSSASKSSKKVKLTVATPAAAQDNVIDADAATAQKKKNGPPSSGNFTAFLLSQVLPCSLLLYSIR